MIWLKAVNAQIVVFHHEVVKTRAERMLLSFAIIVRAVRTGSKECHRPIWLLARPFGILGFASAVRFRKLEQVVPCKGEHWRRFSAIQIIFMVLGSNFSSRRVVMNSPEESHFMALSARRCC